MLNRCYNVNVKSYSNYGAKGRWVCKAWRESYISFINDIGHKPSAGMSLDRIDNDGGYTCGHCDECVLNAWPSNVRWATRREQSLNSTSVTWLECNGERYTISDWTRKMGLGRSTISDRLARGWRVEEAINTPIRGRSIQRALTLASKPVRTTSSRYLGVTLVPSSSRWRAMVTKDDKQHHVGFFTSEDEAAWMRDQWAVSILGNAARLNFCYSGRGLARSCD
jgi:hypothetical protein